MSNMNNFHVLDAPLSVTQYVIEKHVFWKIHVYLFEYFVIVYLSYKYIFNENH